MAKKLLQAVAPWLIVVVVWCVSRTVRRVLVNWHVIEVLERRGEHAVLGVWHNNILFFIDFLGKLWIATMISKSRDGDKITQIARPFGIRPVRGSTSRDALTAIRASVRVLRERHLAITPDGPRGPRYVVQAGIVGVAQLSGAPVVPIAWTASRYWEFGTWDRIKLPKPFATVYVFVGDPIRVARDADVEATRAEIERAMRDLVRHADRFAGGTLTDREPLLQPGAEDGTRAMPKARAYDPRADRKNLSACVGVAVKENDRFLSGLGLRVYAFGSRFRGTARADSDLDLALELSSSLTKDERTLLWCDVHQPLETRLTELVGVPVHLVLYENRDDSPTVHQALEAGSAVIWERIEGDRAVGEDG